MFITDMQAIHMRLADTQKRIDELLSRINQILGVDSCNPLLVWTDGRRSYGDKLNRKKEEVKKRELLLNRGNQLFQLIRFMIKHNHILKRNRLFQLGEMFNLYRKIKQSLIDKLRLMIDNKVIINRKNKVRGDLQWQ